MARTRTLAVTLIILAALCGAFAQDDKKPKCEECCVCKKVLGDIKRQVFKRSASPKKELVEKALAAYCRSAKKKAVNKKGKEAKISSMCYYLEPIQRDVSVPLANGLPVSAVCARLAKKDDQICTASFKELASTGKKPGEKPAPPVDPKEALKKLTSKQIKKMRMKQLKKILKDNKAPCSGCSDKSDYVKRVNELKDEL